MLKTGSWRSHFKLGEQQEPKWGRMTRNGFCREMWKFLSARLDTGVVSEMKPKSFLLDWLLGNQDRLLQWVSDFIKLGFRILDPTVW